MGSLARSALAAAVLALVAACSSPAVETAPPAPPPTVDGARLEQDVRDYLAADPSLAALVPGVVQCPPAALVYPNVVLFCQITGVGRVWSVPVTILDRDGDYRIDKPF
jgi:hypothetical protein